MANHEKHIDDLLKGALGSYAEVPPAGAWADMQNRLANADGAERIDDVLKDALDGYTEVPPAAAWVEMEKMLDEKKSRRRPFVWLWYAAAVTGVLLLAYLFVDKRESDSAFRGKGIQEQIAATPVTQPDNIPSGVTSGLPKQDNVVSQEENNNTSEEIKTHATPLTKTETTITTQKNTTSPTPQQKQSAEQKPAPVATYEKPEAKVKDTPKKEAEPVAQIPAQTGHKETALQQEEQSEVTDDIAQAIKKRGPGTVMNVIRSRYADSMAKVEKELAKLAEERKAAEERAKAKPPVVAAVPETKKEVVKEVPPTTEEGIDPLVKEALDKTEQNLLAKQDAIPGARMKIEIDDSFIGPREDTVTYAIAATDASPEDYVRVRKPMKFDAFMKLGLEMGTSQYKANKYVFAPMLQAHLSNKFSLIFQPAFKAGNANFSHISDDESFYRIESSYMDSIKSYTIGHNAQGIIFDSVRATYYYQETYDSLVVSHDLSSTRVVEFELPLMLNYQVTKGLSLYGGPVVTYSNMLLIDEKKDNYKTTTRRDTITYAVSEASQAPFATPIREVFAYEGKDISEFTPARYANPTINKIRFGYMLGASYNYKRFSADISVQQNISRLDYIPNVKVRNTYMQPYARFMIGYRLNNRKK